MKQPQIMGLYLTIAARGRNNDREISGSSWCLDQFKESLIQEDLEKEIVEAFYVSSYFNAEDLI